MMASSHGQQLRLGTQVVKTVSSYSDCLRSWITWESHFCFKAIIHSLHKDWAPAACWTLGAGGHADSQAIAVQDWARGSF